MLLKLIIDTDLKKRNSSRTRRQKRRSFSPARLARRLDLSTFAFSPLLRFSIGRLCG
jgi:hypothetical protein